MIVNKEEFKRLKSEGGSLFKAIHTIASLEYGYSEIKCGTGLNVYIMNNGIFGDIAFGKKIYIDFNSINDVEVSNDKLIISVNEDEVENKVVFKINNINIIDRIYNTIRQNSNLEYKEIDVQQSNVVTTNASNITTTDLSKRQVEKERVKELKKEHIPYCPKCHSTSLHYIEKRKRLSLGRTLVGGAVGSLVNPVGTVAGAAMGGLTSNKMKKGEVKCLNCGHTWKL